VFKDSNPQITIFVLFKDRTIRIWDQPMSIKTDIKEQMMTAMFNLVRGINKEADNCGKACGGLNEKEQILILYLGKEEEVRMSDLAGIIDAPVSTVTSIVNKLVENEILNREHSVEDRRVINVSLTTKGKSVYKKIRNQKDELLNAVLANLPEKDQSAMIKYINILAASLGKR
jgi:DNA-binding MarR family transcriptional regulator